MSTKVPPDTTQQCSSPISHEGDTHHHELQSLEHRGEDKDLETAHHALCSHHHPAPVSTGLNTTLQDGIAGKKAKGSIIVSRVHEKPSLEEQEQGGFGDENKEFPEGGLQAWSVVIGSFFALFSALTMMNTLGTYILPRKQRRDEK